MVNVSVQHNSIKAKSMSMQHVSVFNEITIVIIFIDCHVHCNDASSG